MVGYSSAVVPEVVLGKVTLERRSLVWVSVGRKCLVSVGRVRIRGEEVTVGSERVYMGGILTGRMFRYRSNVLDFV